jgi:hypothetical protein
LYIGFNKIKDLPDKIVELKKLKKFSLAELEINLSKENEIRNAFPDAELEF